MLQSHHPAKGTLVFDSIGVKPITDFISEFSKQLQHVVKQLQHEQELLIKGDADQISEAAQIKLSSMKELSVFVSNYFNDKADKNINSTDNIEDTLLSVNEICSKHKIEAWSQIKELIGDCHILSEENSILLANRLKYTNNAIDTLFSLAGSTQSKIYDDNGLSQHSRSSRQLASV